MYDVKATQNHCLRSLGYQNCNQSGQSHSLDNNEGLPPSYEEHLFGDNAHSTDDTVPSAIDEVPYCLDTKPDVHPSNAEHALRVHGAFRLLNPPPRTLGKGCITGRLVYSVGGVGHTSLAETV